VIGGVFLLPEELKKWKEYEETKEQDDEEDEDEDVGEDEDEGEGEGEDDDAYADSGISVADAASKEKSWVVKPNRGTRGGGIFVGQRDRVEELVLGQQHLKKYHYVATEYHDNAFPTGKGGPPTSITAFAMLSSSWPLPRVYVHKSSVRINSAPGTTFQEWTDALTRGSSEQGLLDEAEIKYSGDYIYDEDEQDSMIQKMRQQNFNQVWLQSMRNIATCFESSLKTELRTFAKREKKKEKEKEKALWKKYHAESSMCRQKTIYGVDMILGHGNDERLGLLGPAKTRIVDIDRNVDVEGNWGTQGNNTMTRTREALVMMAGEAMDRSQLELVKNKYITPDQLREKRLSNRISWAVQKLTKELCPALYKKRTEANIAKDYEEGSEEVDFDELDCDQEKLGFFASELALATMEYERKKGWVLAHPLKEAKVKKRKGKKEDMLADAIIVRNLFVKWVREHERDEEKAKQRRSGGV